MKQSESKTQQAAVKWFRYAWPNVLIFAIPNGGNRSAITGAILKAEGALAGVPDLFIAQAGIKTVHLMQKNPPHQRDELYSLGLFVEFKTPTGKLSPAQKEVHQKLRDAGYKVEVCRSVDEFMNVVNEYLK